MSNGIYPTNKKYILDLRNRLIDILEEASGVCEWKKDGRIGYPEVCKKCELRDVCDALCVGTAPADWCDYANIPTKMDQTNEGFDPEKDFSTSDKRRKREQ